MEKLESRTVLVEDRMDHLGEQMDNLAMSKESISAASYQESPKPAVYPERLVQLIRRDYKGAVLCPFPWRYCAKKGVPLDDNDPIEAYAAQLNQLGKLAFEALVKDQLAFSAGEMRGQSTEFIEFGFLSREASASKIKPKSSYAFTHKTIQEYFAAFYLAHELLTGDSEKAHC
ncbi:hypothetical protein OS493_038518 [Desmophyllum pertusum]|uniref:Uncharacterized protein n=1 Tax=Desmophyllum pertusum TaxID=174260 RepID=A0A9W9Z6L3_9CNID|nr:hypothetical protein OS493_038518 [Desmophyllum pertusum]